MLQNNVKVDMHVFKQLQKMDDLANGVNASGIFALLVLNMNGDNVSKISMDHLVKGTEKKAHFMGISLSGNASVRSMVDHTLHLLSQHSVIKPIDLPLGQGKLYFKLNPKVVRL